ncbi:bacteriorhodopsin [Lichenifustis flavocetrariae]|uniref:Bacteriorhodopsin-like n=1 Tax=Lichenifustis flavocetrariae TaxID=2949735 RepID=A0AA42CK97_9HYPH|nr:bacteriorhodopsin [Lichenifustis flavocetrariae]MCW6509001.1 bacteriorhodopsin-like [Lichenifustis flavocetrariae]
MNGTVLQATDVAGGTFSVALFGLIAEAVLLLLATGWVARAWKLPVALSAVVALVAAFGTLQARDVWLATHQIPISYQYVGWAVTMPLQVLTFFFFVATLATPPAALFWRLLVVSILMVVVRYMGEAGFTHAALSFLIGIVGWLYILGELFFGRLNEIVANSHDEPVQRGYFWMRLIVTIGWAIYPLCNFIAGFGGGVGGGSLAITYNLADFVNRIAFGLAVLATAMLKTDAAPRPQQSRF